MPRLRGGEKKADNMKKWNRITRREYNRIHMLLDSIYDLHKDYYAVDQTATYATVITRESKGTKRQLLKTEIPARRWWSKPRYYANKEIMIWG